MRTFLTIGFLFSVVTIFGQSKQEIDSTVQVLCHFLTNLETSNPLERREIIMQEVKTLVDQSNYEDPEEAELRLFIRLEKYCLSFQDLTEQLYPVPGAPQRFKAIPESTISKKQIRQFKKLTSLYYLVGTDTVRVIMQRGKWQDHFTDGTTSKCIYEWNEPDTFVLFFQESNNKSRKLLSYPGEEYHYTLYAYEDGCYKAALYVPGVEIYRNMLFWSKK